MDIRGSECGYYEYGCGALAYVWHHAFPVAGGLPCYAGGAHDVVAKAEELFYEESVFGCAA